jgi:hypothetical protein
MAVEQPALLATNVNQWLRAEDKKEDKRMVRVLDGNVRAVLSNRYRALENEDLAEAVLPLLLDMDLMILSSEITDRRFYIKAVSNAIKQDVPTGKRMGDGGHTIFDTVQPGITIANSEVGFGALSVSSTVWTRACTNLADFGASIRKAHLGGRSDVSDDVYQLLSDKTKQKTDEALWHQIRDVVKNAFNEAKFGALTKKLGKASEDKITGDVVEVVERVGKRFNLAEGDRKGILARLIEGGDLTRYGLHSAVTRHSADVESYDDATELEKIGGNIIDLAPSQWSEVLKAA